MSLPTEPTCTEVLDLIEPYLDGEGELDHPGLEEHFARCPACGRELALARKVREGLRSLPVMPCPQRVVDRVTASLPVATLSLWRRSRGRHTGPLLAAAALVLLVLSALLIQRWTASPQEALRVAATDPAEKTPELVQAEQEVRLAFAYLGAISRRAGLTLRDEVIVPGVFAGLRPRSAFGPQEKRP